MAAKIGQWAFMVGVLIAVVIGLFSSRLGADLGGAALMLTGLSGDTLSNIPKIGSYLSGIVVQIAVFVTPAAIVVALKAIQSLAKE